MKAMLVTGGAGFIGSNFIRYVLRERPGLRVVNLDALTYAGNLESLRDVEGHPGYRFCRGDVANPDDVARALEGAPVEAVVNFAAESHVDRSILDPGIFVRTNVLGTQTLLDQTRRMGERCPAGVRYLQVSTDEVYGSLGPEGAFTEATPLAPNSPYSASKAGADMLVRAAHHTFGQDVVITRCSNNFGPYQFPEKLIPLMIANALEEKELPVYGDGLNVRDWLYVEDHCAALLAVLERGRSGEVYNIGGHSEKTNIEVVRTLLRILRRSETLIRFVKDRPGHDRRYAIDSSKLVQELGWRPSHRFEAALEATVDWYLHHQEWVARVRSGEYLSYYDRQYGERLRGERP
ncbi:MAG: dTDP-glucose 4,6-dehydratase [Planctomycetota bacterium]